MGLFDNFGSIDYSGLQTIFDDAIGSMIDNAISVAPDADQRTACLLYTSPSPRDRTRSRMPSSA